MTDGPELIGRRAGIVEGQRLRWARAPRAMRSASVLSIEFVVCCGIARLGSMQLRPEIFQSRGGGQWCQSRAVNNLAPLTETDVLGEISNSQPIKLAELAWGPSVARSTALASSWLGCMGSSPLMPRGPDRHRPMAATLVG